MTVRHHGIHRLVRRMQMGCTMHAERFALCIQSMPNLAYPDEKGFGENSNVDCLGLAIGSQMTNSKQLQQSCTFRQHPALSLRQGEESIDLFTCNSCSLLAPCTSRAFLQFCSVIRSLRLFKQTHTVVYRLFTILEPRIQRAAHATSCTECQRLTFPLTRQLLC